MVLFVRATFVASATAILLYGGFGLGLFVLGVACVLIAGLKDPQQAFAAFHKTATAVFDFLVKLFKRSPK